jgi:peptidoglycan/xylan/chitin deacetylase (PgdA/CDA1 family)
MAERQIVGRVRIPGGKKVAVGLGVDFDALSLWDGSFHYTSPAYLSRGEYGAEVGAERLLELFARHDVKTTWCIPGHTVDTFPEICREVKAAGHEIAHHSYAHENPTLVDRDREQAVLQKGLESLERIGVRPRGYRSPAWDFSPHTLSLLEEFGFVWDSSLMANDIHPYRPRTWSFTETVQHGPHRVAWGKSVHSDPSKIIEIPVTWYLDDFPAAEFVWGIAEAMTWTRQIEDRWRDFYDYAVEQDDGGVFPLTIHPQVSARPHMFKMLERVIEYAKHEGAFMTLSEIADATEFQQRTGAREVAQAPPAS